MQQRYERAGALIAECIARRRALSLKSGLAGALLLRGSLALADPRHPDPLSRAEADFLESEALFREIRELWGLAGALLYLADIAHLRGDCARAGTYHTEATQCYEETGDQAGMADVWRGLARLAWRQGCCHRAHDYAEQAHQQYQQLGERRGEGLALLLLARLAEAAGEAATAQAYREAAHRFVKPLDPPYLLDHIWPAWATPWPLCEPASAPSRSLSVGWRSRPGSDPVYITKFQTFIRRTYEPRSLLSGVPVALEVLTKARGSSPEQGGEDA